MIKISTDQYIFIYVFIFCTFWFNFSRNISFVDLFGVLVVDTNQDIWLVLGAGVLSSLDNEGISVQLWTVVCQFWVDHSSNT